MYKKGGPLNLLTWLKGGGGYLKNMGAISEGLEKIWNNKKQFSSTPPSNLNYDWSLKERRKRHQQSTKLKVHYKIYCNENS